MGGQKRKPGWMKDEVRGGTHNIQHTIHNTQHTRIENSCVCVCVHVCVHVASLRVSLPVSRALARSVSLFVSLSLSLSRSVSRCVCARECVNLVRIGLVKAQRISSLMQRTPVVVLDLHVQDWFQVFHRLAHRRLVW